MEQVAVPKTVRHFSYAKQPLLVGRSVKLIVERRNAFKQRHLRASGGVLRGNEPYISTCLFFRCEIFTPTKLDSKRAAGTRVKNIGLFVSSSGDRNANEKPNQ